MEALIPSASTLSNQNNEEISINVEILNKTARILMALKHPHRQQLLKLLRQHCKLTVTEMYTMMGLEQSATSQHLAYLRRAGMVMTKKRGKKVYYTVNYQRLYEINQCCIKLLGVLPFRVL